MTTVVMKPKKDRRRTILMGIAAVTLVAIGYFIVLLIGGQTLRNLPGAGLVGRIGRGFGSFDDRPPGAGPLPVLQAEPGGPTPAPSPVVPRPSPSASFIPPAPDAPSIVTFTIEFENNTGVRLTGVRISDRLPAGTVYRPDSATAGAGFDGAQISWEVGTLDPGQTGKVAFQVLTNRKGRISNRATLVSNEAPPSEVEASATVS